ncbi:MAG: PepSY-associated TM helix domain-containing protein [Opitutaceae bacterium]
MSAFTRKVLLPLHLWAGLTIGLILVVVAVTGSMLVFRPQLERRLDSQKFVVEPGLVRLAPDDLVARARAAHPTGEIESIRYYGDPTAPFLVYFSNRDYVHLNPYTGSVLGVRQRYGSLFGWAEGMHKFLLLEPTIGEPIMGYVALIFGIIIFSGIVLWWPASRRALKAGLTLNRRLKGRPWTLNLHKTFGAYAAVMLLISVSTGVPISLDWAKDALYPLTGSKLTLPPIPPAAAKSAAFIGFNAVASSIAAVFPGAEEGYIPMPKKGLITAYVLEAGAAHPYARSYVWLEPSAAKIIRAAPYRQAGTGYRLYYWMASLHTGQIGGPVVQFLLLCGALSIPVLAYSGTASYLRRKYGKTAAQSAKAPAATPSVTLARSGKVVS